MFTNKNLFSNACKLVLCVVLLSTLFSCTTSAQKEGHIVKDKDGKYYRLTNERVFGNERYRLIEIDTSSFKYF